ncbi:hypothetical protein [Peijinzhouia sedimentorum]
MVETQIILPPQQCENRMCHHSTALQIQQQPFNILYFLNHLISGKLSEPSRLRGQVVGVFKEGFIVIMGLVVETQCIASPMFEMIS